LCGGGSPTYQPIKKENKMWVLLLGKHNSHKHNTLMHHVHVVTAPKGRKRDREREEDERENKEETKEKKKGLDLGRRRNSANI